MPAGSACAGFFRPASGIGACVFAGTLRRGATSKAGPGGKFWAFAEQILGGGCCIFASIWFAAFAGLFAAARLRMCRRSPVIIWLAPPRRAGLTVKRLIGGCYAFVGGFSSRLTRFIGPCS